MASKKHEFKTATFEDGSCVVLRVDPSQPHIMEVVASFYDAARARDYARFENGEQGEHQEDAPIEEPASKAKPQASEPIKYSATDVSERQLAVLDALRSLMDNKNLVEVRSAELAKASSIPLGSLHSVLASLEKKNMITTERQGTAKLRAIYEVR